MDANMTQSRLTAANDAIFAALRPTGRSRTSPVSDFTVAVLMTAPRKATQGTLPCGLPVSPVERVMPGSALARDLSGGGGGLPLS